MSDGVQDAFPTPSSTSVNDPDVEPANSEKHFQRRLRHLTSVQIRNLTPFPVRDAFASALSQPATHSQFTPLGNLSDDLDVTLLRKRSRRISTTSVNTLKNVALEDVTGVADETKAGGEGRGRRRAPSRVGFTGGGSGASAFGSGNTSSRSLVTSAPIARQSRIRTTSTISSHGLLASLPSNPTTIPVSGLYWDHSQRTLEKVVRSRLVETFIAIAVPQLPPLLPSPEVHGKTISRAASGPSTSPPPGLSVQATRRGSKSFGSTRIGMAETSSSSSRTASRSFGTESQLMVGQISSSSPATTKTHRVSSSPMRKSSSHQFPLPSSADVQVFPKVPNYVSPIHRPSTNPLYSLDALSHSDFSEHTNLSAERLRIQLWAKVDLNAMHTGSAKGKQKDGDEAEGLQWKVLEEWEFSLSELIPLSPELENHPARLPSNTLVMSFLPTGQCFHLPPARTPSRSQSRSPSPTGYNTDPELEGRKLIQNTEAVPSGSHDIIRSSQSSFDVPRRFRKLVARTANFEELSEVATQQNFIRQTEELLHGAIREVDLYLAENRGTILKREASERKARIEGWRAEAQVLNEGSGRLRANLATRRSQIKARRESLANARAFQVREISPDLVAAVTTEKNNLIAIRNRIPPIRTSLISTLATIYPIELLSTSELLFTILAVPLPIPFNPNEPAPPLSLLSHKEVTEESVATALGYAAHLVQLLSVYMGKGLVYPITYIGSRSLIRDNISAMVGPRMFPLFSRGVDTYRFEYAVFLLNKDIEMLMAARDLRALDMRHTLPNLKNLLLTLADEECANAHNPRYQDSPCMTGLTTPPRRASPSGSNLASETPRAGQSPSLSIAELPEEPCDSPSDGMVTPKAIQGEANTSTLSRYSKLSLGFPPLPGFFRSRYSPTVPQASAKTTTDTVEENREGAISMGPSGSSEGVECNPATKAEDDDDRHTIKGVMIDTAEQGVAPEVKEGGDGRAPDDASSTEEKMIDATSLMVVAVDSYV